MAGGGAQSAAVFDDVDARFGDGIDDASIQSKFVDLDSDFKGDAEKERFHAAGTCF